MALFILYYSKIKKCCNPFLEWTNKHVAFTDNCLFFIFFSFSRDVAGCRCTAVKNGWNMEKNPNPYTFGNTCLSLTAGAGVRPALELSWLLPVTRLLELGFPSQGKGWPPTDQSPVLRESINNEPHALAQRSPWWRHPRPLLQNCNTASLGQACHCYYLPSLPLLMSSFVGSHLAGFCI